MKRRSVTIDESAGLTPPISPSNEAGIQSRPAAGLGELRPRAAKAAGSLGAANIVEAEAPATQKLIEAKPQPQPD
jgi:hypothetical protein